MKPSAFLQTGQATNRLAEAEPLMRRALAICVASLGADHPISPTVMGNYADLLGEMGHGEEEVLERFQSLQRELLGQPPTQPTSAQKARGLHATNVSYSGGHRTLESEVRRHSQRLLMAGLRKPKLRR